MEAAREAGTAFVVADPVGTIAVHLTAGAVEQVPAVSHLGQALGLFAVLVVVGLAVLLDEAVLDLLHLAISPELVHAGRNAVGVVADPHSGIVVHRSIARVEQVVILTNLGKALGNLIAVVVVGLAVDRGKTVLLDIPVGISVIPSRGERASPLPRSRIDVDAGAHAELAQRS